MVDHVFFWNRPLTADEARALSANPWQMFEPNTRWNRFKRAVRWRLRTLRECLTGEHNG